MFVYIYINQLYNFLHHLSFLQETFVARDEGHGPTWGFPTSQFTLWEIARWTQQPEQVPEVSPSLRYDNASLHHKGAPSTSSEGGASRGKRPPAATKELGDPFTWFSGKPLSFSPLGWCLPSWGSSSLFHVYCLSRMSVGFFQMRFLYLFIHYFSFFFSLLM